MSLFEKTASEHLRSLESGEVSSVELTQAYLDRIQAVDGKVAAFLRVDGDRALEQAAEVDARRRQEADGGAVGGPADRD